MPDVAAEAGFWGRVAASVTTLEFDSLSRIGTIRAPLLMLHGTADKTVPVALGRRLRDAAPPGVTWVEVPGGSHSRLHEEAAALYQATMHT
jgi:pimeloyl-ACP methyl ester carboxylesterase